MIGRRAKNSPPPEPLSFGQWQRLVVEYREYWEKHKKQIERETGKVVSYDELERWKARAKRTQAKIARRTQKP